mmetsp:Transcript_42057/g.75835  ORF Transcript_42057/g.75835 Transcript_42057/m.75835 type:complete len:575 (-) Transcript_42057:495-2219(-)
MMVGGAGTGRVGAGLWSEFEKSQFERGVITHGWGNWCLIDKAVPTRSKAQIKSHAQKFRRHRPHECERLQIEHEARVERQKVVAMAATCAVTPKRKKAAVVRRRGSLSKSATKAMLSPALLRSSRRRCSAPPGNIVGAAITPKRRGSSNASLSGPAKSPTKKTPTKKPAAKFPAHAARSPPRDILMDVTSAVSRVSLGHWAAPTVSAGCFDLMSPCRPSASKQDPQEDVLSALAAAVTPFPAPRNMNIDELMLVDDTLNDALLLAKAEGDDDAIDPLMQLEVDDDNLDTIADFLDPSWNMMLPDFDATPQDDSLFPFALAPSLNGAAFSDSFVSQDSAPPVAALGEALFSNDSERCEIPPKVCPDLQLFQNIRSQLTSSPDFNNPKEYVLGGDGFSRICLERGALCRARIKDMLGEQLDMGWWKGGVIANTDGTGVIQPALGAPDKSVGVDSVGKLSFEKFALERLIALTVVMLDVDHWQVVTNASSTAVMEGQRFNDEDDIRHIGQLISGLWERVNRSLCRDGFSLLGLEWGNNSSVAMRTERYAAINQMVTRLDMISHQEENINIFSSCVGV